MTAMGIWKVIVNIVIFLALNLNKSRAKDERNLVLFHWLGLTNLSIFLYEQPKIINKCLLRLIIRLNLKIAMTGWFFFLFQFEFSVSFLLWVVFILPNEYTLNFDRMKRINFHVFKIYSIQFPFENCSFPRFDFSQSYSHLYILVFAPAHLSLAYSNNR